ncbi:MAG TPA: hypothetical protein VGR53_05990 [Nitrososphaerales archaeon]|nr:hypothetical protein [Nitrososphaerales archaeon]
MDTEAGNERIRLSKWLAVLVVALLAVAVVLALAWVILRWSISESVYSAKAGLDWFGITFYHEYTFIAAALFSLLLVNPRPGRSDLRRLGTVVYRLARPYEAEGENRPSEKMNIWLWGLWQTVKWAIGFYTFATFGAFLFLGPVMNPITMMSMGLGSWADVPRAFTLPFAPASGSGLIGLMPTLTIQYAVIVYVLSAFLLVAGFRVLIRLLANLAIRRSGVWLRNLLTLVALILFETILGAPYWLMNIATPYVYGIVWSALLLSLLGIVALSKRDVTSTRLRIFKGIAVLLAILLLVQVAAGAFYYFNWNNNFLAYQWYPQTQKQISVTRWAAGLDSIHVNNITTLPTSNPRTTLDLVRQWDQQAASVTNTKEIGAYNWMGLASSEIVFYNGTEYWVSPTTPVFPSTDWISEHLIYTHAAKVLVINTHNGSVIKPTNAFGIKSEPPIYYGEGDGFNQNVYVHVPGYNEIQNVSYSKAVDYTLSGWQKSMWFTFAEGQLGFAFSGQPIDMQWNRNIFSRVGDVLISGLTMDPSAYIVSDGKNLYYTVQVYIDYPLQSGFADSPYLRFFGVVLVNIQDGSLQGYTVSNLLSPSGVNGTDFITKFYQGYYSTWRAPPAWLVPQLRYPEQLLGSPTVHGQLDYNFVYHVNSPFIFRSGTQFYERAGDSNVQYIPFAVGNKTYFVGLQLAQYQGVVSKNLGALYIAYGGDRLGQVYLYQNPSQSALIIGPTAAENALTTNQQVRTQLTLLPNNRFGSYLLYSVGGALTYFVAVYTNPGSSGVVTQLPFMTAINPSTGVVGVGLDAASAFNNLGAGNSTTGSTPSRTALVHQIDTFLASKSYRLVNATSVNPTVYVNVASVSLSAAGATQTIDKVANLLRSYGPGSVANTVYSWIDNAGNLNFGLIVVPAPGVTYMYYVTIKQ